VAEKLDAPVTLNEIDFVKDYENTGYDDAFRGTNKETNTNEDLDGQFATAKKKKKEKDINKARE